MGVAERAAYQVPLEYKPMLHDVFLNATLKALRHKSGTEVNNDEIIGSHSVRKGNRWI
jgi:hypothetical protein